MVRKILYSLILVSLVLIVNQVRNANGALGSGTNDSTLITTTVMTGSAEVCVTASQAPAEVSVADITISSVEIYLASGWTKMKMENTNKIDLTQIDGSDQPVATITGLNPGTYTQVRITLSSANVTLKGNQPAKTNLSSSTLSFTRNFQVAAKNTVVLVINFDPIKSINDTNPNQIVFTPVAIFSSTDPCNSSLPLCRKVK